MNSRVAVTVVLLAAGDATAAMDEIIHVAQPLIGFDMGVMIGFEGYAGYAVGVWEERIRLTCAENSTRILGGSGMRGDAETEDRNAASIVGLSIRHVPAPRSASGPSVYGPLFGDTLRVTLTVPESAVRIEEDRGWTSAVSATLREVLCTTIECACINAAGIDLGDRHGKPRYLAVEIEGWEGGGDLARTYPLYGVEPVRERRADCYYGTP